MTSMLNLPGEFLKSGVSNVVSGGRRLVGASSATKTFEAADGTQHTIKEKTTMQIKGTPNKDAITTSSYASKCGYMMKRNEQGEFRRRFVCTVPHMFLYYFDNEIADSPKGIIDLELFTKIEIESDNETIKLSTQEENGLRPYFLKFVDNNDQIADWVGSLLRDRYNIIKEERDAYRQLQDHFTGEMEVSSRQMKSSTQDMERLLKDVSDARRETEDVLRYIANALSIIGISEEEMKKLTTNAQYGNALANYLKQYIQANDAKIASEKEVRVVCMIGYGYLTISSLS